MLTYTNDAFYSPVLAGLFNNVIEQVVKRENDFIESSARKHAPQVAALVDSRQFKAAAIHLRALGFNLVRFTSGALAMKRHEVMLDYLAAPIDAMYMEHDPCKERSIDVLEYRRDIK